jgi:hypothetical protein
VLASRRTIRNSKNIKLYPNQLTIFPLQPLDQFKMLPFALL